MNKQPVHSQYIYSQVHLMTTMCLALSTTRVYTERQQRHCRRCGALMLLSALHPVQVRAAGRRSTRVISQCPTSCNRWHRSICNNDQQQHSGRNSACCQMISEYLGRDAGQHALPGVTFGERLLKSIYHIEITHTTDGIRRGFGSSSSLVILQYLYLVHLYLRSDHHMQVLSR